MSNLKQKGVLFSKNTDIFKIEMGSVLTSVKLQLDDHLTAINENTNEIQSNFEAVCEINHKVEKVMERIERIEAFLFNEHRPDQFEVKPLTKKEKELFFALYTLTESSQNVTYEQLSKKVCWTHNLVASYVTNLIAKGVPIRKRFVDKRVMLALDQKFRELQAKKNILKIDTRLTYWI